MKKRGAHNAIFKKMSIKGKTQDQQRKSGVGAMFGSDSDADEEEYNGSVQEMDIVKEDRESVQFS